MAPKGPMLPRKQTALARSKGTLESAAFQVGTIVAVERNRQRRTQGDLAAKVGLNQVDVSAIENGQPPPSSVSDATIDMLFRELGLPAKSVHANYLKWWRDNSTV
jgi:DNA-binding XRE family transcriptional regulator